LITQWGHQGDIVPGGDKSFMNSFDAWRVVAIVVRKQDS
jgi:hypothetical protein